MKIKKAYDRIGIQKARQPILEYLPNNSDVLNLVEIWDGGPMEGHLFIQKNGNNYILYEITHHFNSNSETVYRYKLSNIYTIQGIANEIQNFYNNRYEGTGEFDFTSIVTNIDVLRFFGL